MGKQLWQVAQELVFLKQLETLRRAGDDYSAAAGRVLVSMPQSSRSWKRCGIPGVVIQAEEGVQN